MKKITGIALLFVFVFSIVAIIPSKAEARSGAYYKSASTGRFTTKSSYKNSPSTTYRSYRR